MSKTIRQAADDWLRLSAGRYKPTTHRVHATILRDLLRALPDMQLRNLRQQHMENYFYSQDTGLAHRVRPSTANHYRRVIAAFLRFSLNRGWLRDDPLANVPPFRPEQRERVRLSRDDLLRALDLARHPRDRAFLALAMNTGFRVSELLSLKVTHIDLDLGEIQTRIHKTGKFDRFPINADLDLELRTWITFYQGRCGPLHPDWFLLPAKERLPVGGNRKILADPIDAVLCPGKKMSYPAYLLDYVFAGLGVTEKGVGAHTFRRSIARLYYDRMLQESGSRDHALRLTMVLLNHSSSATTEGYIGVERERAERDRSLRGVRFLTADPEGTVVPLRKVNDG